MSMMKYVLLAGMVLGFSGCEGTISDDGSVSISAGSGSVEESLTTLALNEDNIQTLLRLTPWTKIETDVQAFYESGNYPETMQSYSIVMTFDTRTVSAYADCQKVTARYRLDGKDISFYDAEIAPAVDLPACVESEYADDAVLALFENSFEVVNMTEDEMVLQAFDFDTQVILKR